MRNKIFTTPKGVAWYPHLRTPETFEGSEIGYTIKVMFDTETALKFQQHLEAELEKAKAAFPGKNFKNPFLGASEDNDGNLMFKFKANTSFKTKAGDIIHRTIPIYDSTGKPLDEKADIGTGSVVRVAYSIFPYYKSAQTNGLSLRLEAVQVIEYKAPYSKDAESYGFGTEEGGYVADEDNNSDLFPPDEVAADEGADF
ncbi:MAG: hypothetical protein DBY32_11355 [Phascolarctobacterium sp.]|nr:MAG: hypothetical protein DBY32_11355 [Phascolarctobacterium sp.]